MASFGDISARIADVQEELATVLAKLNGVPSAAQIRHTTGAQSGVAAGFHAKLEYTLALTARTVEQTMAKLEEVEQASRDALEMIADHDDEARKSLDQIESLMDASTSYDTGAAPSGTPAATTPQTPAPPSTGGSSSMRTA